MNGIRGGDNESKRLYTLSRTVPDMFLVRNMFFLISARSVRKMSRWSQQLKKHMD